MKKYLKKKWIWVLVLCVLTVWVLWANTALEVHTYQVESCRIPEGFSGFRIVQISDLHNARFGEENRKLLDKIKAQQPDIILLTGDLVDSSRTDLEIAIHFAEKAALIAPVYYVTGNHEAWIGTYGDLKTGLEAAGVTVLENEKVRIARGKDFITLAGIHDPSFLIGRDDAAAVGAAIRSLQAEEDGYTVLLYHRPELFETYTETGVDLVCSGHAHGGQFRIPLLGGLVAPNQGLFPKYDAGMFLSGNTCMIVSRGLGNSVIPLRFCNRPEIVVAELIYIPQ